MSSSSSSAASSRIMLNISCELLNGMSGLVRSIVSNAVRHCGSKYNFDAEEALRYLDINDMSLSVSEPVSVSVSKPSKPLKSVKAKEVVVKSKYPLPFCGESKEGCCQALRQNHGLYTQCETAVVDETYCNKCGPSPQFGTIQERLAVGLMEFRDSKGKGPIHFLKVMKKLKISRAEVEEEAGKLNIIINPIHFEEEKVEKKEKGRPKKAKKIVELEDNSTDLFAALVAKANEESDDSEEEESCDEKVSLAESVIDTVLDKVSVTVENNEKKAEKDAEKQKKEEEKQALIQKKAAEKAEKDAEKQKKEEEKQALIQKKEAEKQKKEEEKQALIQKKEAEKALKEAEKEAAKQKKEAEKKSAVKSKKETSDSDSEKKKSKPAAEKKVTKEVEEEEEDVVKRFEFEGVKYLKSKKTGIIYNMEQDVIGKWNEKTGKIDFEEAGSEEEEEEYDE
jgi:hypothetical protein